MATERLRNKLRSACLAGAEPREVAALLHPGRAVSAAPHLAGWCFRQPSAAAALQPKASPGRCWSASLAALLLEGAALTSVDAARSRS